MGQFIKTVRPGDRKVWVSLSKQRGPGKERCESVYQNSETWKQKGVSQLIKTVRPGDRKVLGSLSKQRGTKT